MLYFKHPGTDEVFAYATQAERDVFGDPALVAMTPEELAAQLNLTAITVPQVVTRFQARAALHLAGLLPQVEALMSHPDTPMLAKLAWADAQDFKRSSPTIAQMSGALGLTDQQLDELFTIAAEIDA